MKLPANLIALLEAFLAIADTPNISRAAHSLGISRVTLQSRMKALEAICGYELLEFDSHNRYKLTTRAKSWAQEIRIWLRQGEDIFSMTDAHIEHSAHSLDLMDDASSICQRHPLNQLWEHDTPYLKSMMNAWLASEGQFSNQAFDDVCKNSILVRPHYDEFVIMGIGEKAAIMNWLGKESCLSSLGIPLSLTAISTKDIRSITSSYGQALIKGSPLYDHISAELPRPEKGTKERAYYRRLILPCKLPDGSALVASIVELSDDIKISNNDASSLN